MRRREQRRRSLLSAAWRGRAQATLRSVPLAAALLFGFPVVCEVQEMVDEEGNRYLGEVVDGVRAGQGRYEWTNGNIYEGTFENNEISGSGVFTWPDGRRYEGEFSQGMKHGQGEYTWPNGDTYLGQYENDQISGTGVFTWAETKAKYEGQFRNGRKHGRGVYTWPDSRRYEGQFVNDQRDGLGIVREVDGSAFQGYFVQNRKHGIGVVFAEDGSREVQEWRNGEMVHSEQVTIVEECRLTMNESDWMFRSESCINGLAHGEGLAVRVDGQAYVANGRFVLGRLVAGQVQSLVLETQP